MLAAFKLDDWEGSNEPGVCGSALLYEVIPLALLHLLELEVSRMRRRAEFTALQDDEQDRPDDGDKVQREVHEVADDGRRGKLGEWLRHKLAQLCYWVTA